MFARAASGIVLGVQAQHVVVESHRAKGLPGTLVVGLARGAMKESAVRVRSAMLASGLSMGLHRLVVNLLPAQLPKEGSGLDLALAVSLLASGGDISGQALQGRRFLGELSLSGALEPVSGALLLADLSRCQADEELIVPQACAAEAAIIPGVRVVGAANLAAVVAHLQNKCVLPAAQPSGAPRPPDLGCLSDVFGQHRAKRALEIAAAGGHNMLMIGPPGSGKTMLARRLPALLPALSSSEAIEVTRVHSAAAGTALKGLVRTPPFRSPHHTASEPALCGGGSIPRPGEITLAHRGVLFLDEFPEFSRRALESLREPLEEGCVHVARASMSLRFPAEVLLLAAMNPCPCGYGAAAFPRPGQGAGDSSLCMCSFDQVARYRARLSGPLLDRIDLHVAVCATPFRDFGRRDTSETSAKVAQRVDAARAAQTTRLGPQRLNARMTPAQLQSHASLGSQSLAQLETAVDAHRLSGRAIGRVLKVARTIADLDGASQIAPDHLKEALSFRLIDQAQVG